MVDLIPKNIIPAGSVSFKEFPEKILLQGKKYPIQILLKNSSETKDNPVDYYLKYRINGFKIIDIKNILNPVIISTYYQDGVIENILIELMTGIFTANQLPNSLKESGLLGLNSFNEILKLLYRLAREISAMDDKQYLTAEADCQEIGKMLGGWIKYLKSQR